MKQRGLKTKGKRKSDEIDRLTQEYEYNHII